MNFGAYLKPLKKIIKKFNSKIINICYEMHKHLIKRSKSFKDDYQKYLMQDGWYCESKYNSKPAGYKVKEGDLIYVAEAGYAIYGSGEVDKVNLKIIQNPHELLDYVFNITNIKDAKYWFEKIKLYHSKTKINEIHNKKYFILEYTLVNTETFKVPYILTKRFKQQSSWYYLEKDFSLNQFIENKKLSLEIPSYLRASLYNKYKLLSKSHLIDIDHFVPKSLGGPGNIEENLVPVGLSLNRYKSNSVPSRVFRYSNLLDNLIKINKKCDVNIFYNDDESKSLAKNIISKINELDFHEIKKIYLDINKFHNPKIL